MASAPPLMPIARGGELRRVSAAALTCLLAASGLSTAISGTAAAQTADTPPEAIEHYARAREHFEAGEYEDAAAALERAQQYDADSPTLAYNLARVYELMGRLDESLAQYRRYQELLPQQQAREQEQADSTIRRLQGALENNAARQQEEPPAPPQEVEPLRQLPGIVLVRERGVADAPFWVALTGGAVAVATGAVVGVLAFESSSQVESFVLGRDGGIDRPQELQDQAEIYGAIADVSFGIGGAALLVAVTLYFIREHTVERAPVGARETPTVDVQLGEDQAVLVVGGQF